MLVKINGIPFNPESVLRFAPISGNLEMPEQA